MKSKNISKIITELSQPNLQYIHIPAKFSAKRILYFFVCRERERGKKIANFQREINRSRAEEINTEGTNLINLDASFPFPFFWEEEKFG